MVTSDQSDSKVYATIDSFPPAIGSLYPGEWVIGGATYSATIDTDFEEDNGVFANGVCVKAEYEVEGGVNLLDEVQTEAVYKCRNSGDTDDEFKAYGVIETLPNTPGFTGTWQISGFPYEVDNGADLDQEHGIFAVGAYVEVKYTRSGGQNLADKIETHVAPNGGRETVTGILTGQGMQRGLTAASDDWADWTVNGVAYKADPAISAGSGKWEPALNKLVALNTYNRNGVTYATTAKQMLPVFLPIVLK